jgi:Ca2+-binding EF-hand superfamily protein
MKRHVLFAATALVATGLGFAAAAFAQTTTAPDKPRRMQVDVNGDGFIDRSEAAKLPRLAEKFDELDKNGDGRLDSSERPQRKRGHGDRHGGIERADADGDGRISRAELESAEAARAEDGGTSHGHGRGLLDDFDTIDSNKDGHLVRGELRTWHERMRPQRAAEHAQRANEQFAETDLNRDGKLSRVEVEEKMPHAAEQFAWMDENRDGFLSREEAKPYGRR